MTSEALQASVDSGGLDGCDLLFEGRRYRYLVVAGTEPALPDTLTASERDVARRAAAGQSSREIAVGRGTSKRTVENQLDAGFRKLGISCRSELCERVYGSSPRTIAAP